MEVIPLEFRERPTLDDLRAFVAEADRLKGLLREFRAHARACKDAADGTRDKHAGFVNRYIKRTAGDRNSRDTGVFGVAPGTRAKATSLDAESLAWDQRADEALHQLQQLEAQHQVQAHDWREFISQGLDLPAHRKSIYAAALLAAA